LRLWLSSATNATASAGRAEATSVSKTSGTSTSGVKSASVSETTALSGIGTLGRHKAAAVQRVLTKKATALKRGLSATGEPLDGSRSGDSATATTSRVAIAANTAASESAR